MTPKELGQAKRAILYARVSTDAQAEEGSSLRTQIESCAEYAAANGLAVPGDDYRILDDYTGSQLSRPGLDRARELLEGGQAEAIVVHASDRLTRQPAHLIILREEWQRLGVELHFVNRGKSEDNPEARLLENVEAIIAEYEREKIRERTMRGKRRKAQDGKWVGGHAAPYGYRREGKGRTARLAILEREARVVRQIFDWYTGAGQQMPLPTAAIARRLTAAGVPTPSRGKKGRGWFRDTVNCVLSNPVYIGELRFQSDRRRPDTVVITQAPEVAIVPEHTWAVAQAIRSRNKARARAACRGTGYLLAGHLKCACRKALVGITVRPSKDGKLYRYYRCGGQASERHLTDCRQRGVPAEEAESKLWAWVRGLLESEDNIRAGLRRLAERQEIELAPRRARLALVEELIEQAAARIARWVAAFGDESDDLVRATVQAQIRETGKVRDELIAERDRLAAALGQGELTPEDEARIVALAAELRAGLAEADDETQRYLMERLDVQGVLTEDAGGRWLDCTCAVPGWQATVVLAAPGLIDKKGSCGRAPRASPPETGSSPGSRCSSGP